MLETGFQVSRSVNAITIRIFRVFEKGSYFKISEVLWGWWSEKKKREKAGRTMVKDEAL